MRMKALFVGILLGLILSLATMIAFAADAPARIECWRLGGFASGGCIIGRGCRENGADGRAASLCDGESAGACSVWRRQ